jgi:hypothetical protein
MRMQQIRQRGTRATRCTVIQPDRKPPGIRLSNPVLPLKFNPGTTIPPGSPHSTPRPTPSSSARCAITPKTACSGNAAQIFSPRWIRTHRPFFISGTGPTTGTRRTSARLHHGKRRSCSSANSSRSRNFSPGGITRDCRNFCRKFAEKVSDEWDPWPKIRGADLPVPGKNSHPVNCLTASELKKIMRRIKIFSPKKSL